MSMAELGAIVSIPPIWMMMLMSPKPLACLEED